MKYLKTQTKIKRIPSPCSKGSFTSNFSLLTSHFKTSAFSLTEVMVATSILMLMMTMVMVMINNTSLVWKRSLSQSSFQGVQGALNSIANRIGKATLNSYLEYYGTVGVESPRRRVQGQSFTPTSYNYASDLHFRNDQASNLIKDVKTQTQAVFFQAALGLSHDPDKYRALGSLLNTCGYYIEYGSDEETRPGFLAELGDRIPIRYRYRLMEVVQPAELFNVYKHTLPTGQDADNDYSGKAGPTYQSGDAGWLNDLDLAGTANVRNCQKHVLVENIIALLFVPLRTKVDPETNNFPQTTPEYRLMHPGNYYRHNSKLPFAANAFGEQRGNAAYSKIFNRLPPLMRIVAIAIDETSAIRLADISGEDMPFSSSDYAFDINTYFLDASKYDADLEEVGKELDKRSIVYRTFFTDVIIQEGR